MAAILSPAPHAWFRDHHQSRPSAGHPKSNPAIQGRSPAPETPALPLWDKSTQRTASSVLASQLAFHHAHFDDRGSKNNAFQAVSVLRETSLCYCHLRVRVDVQVGSVTGSGRLHSGELPPTPVRMCRVLLAGWQFLKGVPCTRMCSKLMSGPF